jgi:hypothetical protein
MNCLCVVLCFLFIQESSKKEMTVVTDHSPDNSATKRITFTAFGKDWTLDLQKNTMLFGKDMAFEIRDPNSDYVLRTLTGPKDCFYIGTVDAGENEVGLAAVSTCRGKVRNDAYNLNDQSINQSINQSIYVTFVGALR